MNSLIKKKYCAAFVVLGLCGITGHAHSAEEDIRLWTAVVVDGPLANKFRWTAEVQPRWRNDAGDFDQLIVRPSVSYALSEKSSIALGYAYVETETGTRTSKEDRVWQQYLYQSKLGEYNWSSRTRLEQRNLDASNDTSHRLRQMLRTSRPLATQSNWHALAWNELFLNLNDTTWAGGSGFNQNRLFIGTMWRYNKTSRLEVGYLNQYVNTLGNRENQMNHVLASTWFIGF